jgi:hypothetical protein
MAVVVAAEVGAMADDSCLHFFLDPCTEPVVRVSATTVVAVPQFSMPLEQPLPKSSTTKRSVFLVLD